MEEDTQPTVEYVETQKNWDQVSDDYEWERSIELKLSTQGKMIIGLGAGVLVVLGLTGLQGKVVLRLVKANAMVVNTINSIINTIGGIAVDRPDSNVSYTEPSKTVETPEPDPQELEELRKRMEESGYNEGDMFNG